MEYKIVMKYETTKVIPVSTDTTVEIPKPPFDIQTVWYQPWKKEVSLWEPFGPLYLDLDELIEDVKKNTGINLEGTVIVPETSL